LTLSLGIAEVCMRFFYDAHFVISGWNGQYLGVDEINHHGSRGRKISFEQTKKPKVLLLGDSQVVASASKLEEMPESQLERILENRISCTSLAAGGWGQDQQLLNLKRFFHTQKADLVALWFTPMNDIANNLFPTHFPENGWAKPTFWLEEDFLTGPNERQNSLIYATPRIRILEPFKLLYDRPFIFDRDQEWERKILPENDQSITHNPPETEINSFIDRLDINSSDHWFYKYENFENGKNSFSLWIDKVSPRMEYGLKLTNKLLHEINEVCNANNSKLLIFWTEFQPGFNEFPSRQFKQPFEYFRVKEKIYRFSHDAYSANMKKIMEGLSVFPISIKMEKWWRNNQDSHLNTIANNQVMAELAPIITSML
tara:strand:+ start:1081 stop:2193 length:1113 start_codon:yes stop_codon:yes gene_type:complete